MNLPGILDYFFLILVLGRVDWQPNFSRMPQGGENWINVRLIKLPHRSMTTHLRINAY